MPPTDNNTQTTAPTPEKPKQGFFAKLFGLNKKKDETPPVIAPHESYTPPPQLDDPALPPIDQPVNPPVGNSVTSTNGNPNGPEMSEPVPTVEPDVEPPTLDVPDSLKAQPIDVDETNVSPTLPTQPPASGEQPTVVPSGVPPIGSPPNPIPTPADSEEKV